MDRTASITHRNVILTATEVASIGPIGPKNTQSATTGVIACICILIDDGARITETSFSARDEISLLRDFWKAIQPNDLFIGHDIDNCLAFLRKRSWELDIIPSREIDLRNVYRHDTLDTASLWASDTAHLRQTI